MCALQTLSKTAATALLALTNWSWLVGYFVVDQLIWHAYKLVRRDYVWASVPMPTTATYIAAPITRTMGKVMVDFTGTLNLRFPVFFGGAYWLYSLASTQISIFACVHLYNEYAEPQKLENGDEVAKASPRALWTAAAGLAVSERERGGHGWGLLS
jgi:hypothetical protein